MKKIVLAMMMVSSSAWAGADDFIRNTYWIKAAKQSVQHNIDKGVSAKGDTPILKASQLNRHGSVIKILLDNGANVHARDENGDTPLIKATNYNINLSVVEALLDAGADINAKNNAGRTPLMQAADNKNSAIFKVLLARGADVHGQHNFHKETALFYAVDHPDGASMVQMLIAHGADINHRDKIGETPIVAAVRYAVDPQVIKILLDNGAVVRGVMTAGYYKEPLDQAIKRNKKLAGTQAEQFIKDALK